VRDGFAARTWLPCLGLGALVALWLASDAGVAGPAAADEVVRALLAGAALFAISGYALAKLFLPESLAPWRAVFVLPLGACACGMALTLLGFAAVPFKLALALTLAAGVGSAAYAWRRTPSGPAPIDRRQLLSLAAAVAMIAAIALIPTFRSGFATVTGTGSDAHQVAGAATFIQHNYPSGRDVAYPIDEVRAIWNSKFPIFYPLAGTATLSGLEPWEAMMSLCALLLALTALGVFVFTRLTLGGGAGIAALAMALAVLDQQVFHVAVHPYYNQLWGLMTLPFSIVLGHAWVEDRSPKTFALLALVTGIGIFAYPLMLPFPLVAVAGFWVASGGSVDPRQLWRGWRSLLWLVPLGALLFLPLRGVVQKVRDGAEVLVGGEELQNWGGDLFVYPPFAEFFALPDMAIAGPLGAALVVGLAGWLLWRLPRRLGLPLLVVLGGALVTAGWFTTLDNGQYFYYKLLSFSGVLIVPAAAVALTRVPWRPLAALALAGLSAGAVYGAREEIRVSFDQLQRETIELREWSKQLPGGASVRIDTRDQLWRAYMLSDRPLGSPWPIETFPHVTRSFGGDYSLTEATQMPPDAIGGPVFENEDLRLWRLGKFPGKGKLPDTTSRRLEPIAADQGVE